MAESCANCGAPLNGRYCSRCGQDSHGHRLPFRALIADAADQFFSLDGRTMHTMVLLVCAPGELTRDYIAGRHQPYVPALRLYLFITVAFFVALSTLGIALLQFVPFDPKTDAAAPSVSVSNEVAGTVGARIILFRPYVHVTLNDQQRAALRRMQANLEAQTVTSAAIGDRVLRVLRRAYADSETFNADIQTLVARFLLLMMPLFALMTAALRPGRFLLVDHLIFALHFHSFVFIVLAGAVALTALALGHWVLWLALAALAVYLFAALRRAYGLSLVGTAWRAAALFVVYIVAALNGVETLILMTMGS